MTINMGNPDDGPAKNLVGVPFDLVAWAVATNDLVMAVSVSTDCPSINHNKHITIAVNKTNGGKPKHSNQLQNFQKLPNPIILDGVVTEMK
jgi:hypothetical protein